MNPKQRIPSHSKDLCFYITSFKLRISKFRGINEGVHNTGAEVGIDNPAKKGVYVYICLSLAQARPDSARPRCLIHRAPPPPFGDVGMDSTLAEGCMVEKQSVDFP